MKFEIKNRWSGKVQYTCELSAEMAEKSYSVQLGFAVKKAVSEKSDLCDANLSAADLSAANLSAANLSAANLSAANLRDANLSAANLSAADLSDANLSAADLSAANLSAANLRDANLSAADLSAANLRDANLSAADLRSIRADFYDVLAWSPAEVPVLISALKEGRVNGSTYQGKCACLVGTIANARGISFESLEHDSYRPIERFFMSIKEGDTPESNQAAAIAVEWAESWLSSMEAAFGSKQA